MVLFEGLRAGSLQAKSRLTICCCSAEFNMVPERTAIEFAKDFERETLAIFSLCYKKHQEISSDSILVI